ncbi:MAG TPA: hypothetical protein VM681_04970 [Candidatus Thermoplasmatota archaeon]|nr:hypothetical protein [Candidatus Thermoplasmatota archaeon]
MARRLGYINPRRSRRAGRICLVAFTVLVVVASAMPLVMAGGGHGGHHGHHGPVDPLSQSVQRYFAPAGAFAEAPPAASEVAFGESTPGGTPEPVVWTTQASYNGAIKSSVYLRFWVRSDTPNVALFSPQSGMSFTAVLAKNGEPIEATRSYVGVDGGILEAGRVYDLRMFLPAADVAFAKGDSVEIWLTFLGTNPGSNPVAKLLVGGETPSSASWTFSIASLDELGHSHNGFPHFPLQGFPLDDLRAGVPGGVVINVKAFHWGFSPNPIVVANGSHVFLRIYYDNEADDAEIMEGVVDHPEQPDGAAHSFSLETYKRGLVTRLYPGEVVVMDFLADRPGEYMFLCTVFCGESQDASRGHGQTMHGQLVVQKSAAEVAIEEQLRKTAVEEAQKQKTPGLAAFAVLGSLGVLAVLLRRRG